MTYQAYQTVLVWALTKSKKGRMPRFETLLPKRSGGGVVQSAEQMRQAIEVIKAQLGQKSKGFSGQ